LISIYCAQNFVIVNKDTQSKSTGVTGVPFKNTIKIPWKYYGIFKYPEYIDAEKVVIKVGATLETDIKIINIG